MPGNEPREIPSVMEAAGNPTIEEATKKLAELRTAHENPSEAIVTDTPMEKLSNDIKHKYISTACQHDLHTRCRRVCKFCEARCLCWCHES